MGGIPTQRNPQVQSHRQTHATEEKDSGRILSPFTSPILTADQTTREPVPKHTQIRKINRLSGEALYSYLLPSLVSPRFSSGKKPLRIQPSSSGEQTPDSAALTRSAIVNGLNWRRHRHHDGKKIRKGQNPASGPKYLPKSNFCMSTRNSWPNFSINSMPSSPSTPRFLHNSVCSEIFRTSEPVSLATKFITLSAMLFAFIVFHCRENNRIDR